MKVATRELLVDRDYDRPAAAIVGTELSPLHDPDAQDLEVVGSGESVLIFGVESGFLAVNDDRRAGGHAAAERQGRAERIADILDAWHPAQPLHRAIKPCRPGDWRELAFDDPNLRHKGALHVESRIESLGAGKVADKEQCRHQQQQRHRDLADYENVS